MSIFTPVVDRFVNNFGENIYSAYSTIYKTFTKKPKKHIPSNLNYISRNNFDFQRDSRQGIKMTYRYNKRISRRGRYRRYYKKPITFNTTSQYRGKRRYYRRRRKTYKKPSINTLMRQLKANSSSSISNPLNRNRLRVGLPPMHINYFENFDPLNSTNRWLAYASNQFNFSWNLSEIPKGEGLDERDGYTARILSFSLKLHIRQTRDTLKQYRVILVKFMPKLVGLWTTMCIPENILAHTNDISEALASSYLSIEEGRQDYPFKVLMDKRFDISSYGSDNSTRHMAYKIPGANVVYDTIDDTGDTWRNGLCLCVLTDADTDSASYYWGIEYKPKFVDLY